MKKWQRRIVICSSILFVVLNLFLLEKKDSKIPRIEKITHWEKVEIGTINNLLPQQGVVIPEEEYNIYFDNSNGAFRQFLVKVGDEVTVGTPLFEYSREQLDKEIKRFKTEITELEAKASSVKDTITQLGQLLAQAKKDVEKDQPLPLSIYTLEANIYEKELEQDFYLNEVAKLQEQMQILDDSFLTVKSEYDGYVKELKNDLSDPIMTLSSKRTAIKGIFNEAELEKVAAGMVVSISGLAEEFSGSISEISPFPETEPHVESDSTYPFLVYFDNPPENFLTGKHVSIDIILKEATDAFIVPSNSVKKIKKKSYIYVLTPSGTIEKRLVKTGIATEDKVEIKTQIAQGDILVSNSEEIKHPSHSAFITPIKIKDLSVSNVKKNLKPQWKYFLRGFLAR